VGNIANIYTNTIKKALEARTARLLFLSGPLRGVIFCGQAARAPSVWADSVKICRYFPGSADGSSACGSKSRYIWQVSCLCAQ